MEHYTTQHLEILFGITHTTVKKRAREFAEYLSPTATPPDGKRRRFTEEDIKVLALVDDLHKRGYGWEDAHLALKRGERGEIPLTANAIMPVTPASIEERLEMELTTIRKELEDYKGKYNRASGKIELYEKLLAEKEQRIQELYEQLYELRKQTKQ